MAGWLGDLYHPGLKPQSELCEWIDACHCTYLYEILIALKLYSNHSGVLQMLTVF